MPETDFALEPVADDGQLTRVVAEGDPETMLAVLEKKAELATRMRRAIEHIVVSQTYPKDWTIQGDRACLSSAGAERIGRNFPITFRDVTWKKEEWSDTEGKAYRYIYTGYASLYDRTVYAEGSYSTRDEFLGKKAGAWRPLEEINEGDIRSAAHHIFCGNAIKELLGLRGLPVEEYQRIMQATGQDAAQSTKVSRGRGTKGGTTAEDTRHQKELAELCIGFANAGMTVEADGDGNWRLVPLSEADDREPLEIAKAICVELSGFEGQDGTRVRGKGAKDLKGKWLSATLAKARKLHEQLEQATPEPW